MTAERVFVLERTQVSVGETRPTSGTSDSLLRSGAEVKWRGHVMRKEGDSVDREVRALVPDFFRAKI